MPSKFLPVVNAEELKKISGIGSIDDLYDLLAQPLHEALYLRQTFEFYDELSGGQQLLIAFDYLRMQVGQGGFIQFIHNGYVSLLPDMVTTFNHISASGMAQLLDDVLKVFVLNKEYFLNVATVEQFAQIYIELQEFEILDKRFTDLYEPTIKIIIKYAIDHIDEFVTIVD